MENSPTVTQDNALISASYTMSLNEKRLLVLALSKIDPMRGPVEEPSKMTSKQVNYIDLLISHTAE